MQCLLHKDAQQFDGHHDSDTEIELIEMRQNALPILESYGVDVVLCGHSHTYERS